MVITKHLRVKLLSVATTISSVRVYPGALDYTFTFLDFPQAVYTSRFKYCDFRGWFLKYTVYDHTIKSHVFNASTFSLMLF